MVSVVIASYNARRTVARCLDSLRRQTTTASFEVIVVDSSFDGTAEAVRDGFPEVRLIHSARRLHCGDARNRGIGVARGAIVAFMDADCVASRTWVEEILRAQDAHPGAVGGAIANLEPSGAVAWAAYLLEFNRWMPGLPPRWLDDMAAANISYQRRLLDELGPLIEGTYCSDTELHWRMARRGQRIRFCPEIVVHHDSIGRLGAFLSHELMHGRSFARVRVAHRGLSRSRRLAHAASVVLLPLLLGARLARRVARSDVARRHVLRSLPALVAGLCAWSAGECVGYLGRRLAAPDHRSGETASEPALGGGRAARPSS